MVMRTVSGAGVATSMRPPPVCAHLPLRGVTWPCRSCSVMDMGGGGGAAAVTVTFTVPPAGATTFSWAETSDGARANRLKARQRIRRDGLEGFMAGGPLVVGRHLRVLIPGMDRAGCRENSEEKL